MAYEFLIVNDDGYPAEGNLIIELAKCARKFGRVLVVAPDHNRTCASHSSGAEFIISKHHDSTEDIPIYTTTGTPVDAVRGGCQLYKHLFNTPPSHVLSGVNIGANTGVSVYFSGTFNAALHAHLYDIPAAAFSYQSGNLDNFHPELLRVVLKKLLPKITADAVWNVNFPDKPREAIKGLAFTSIGTTDQIVPTVEQEFPDTFKCIQPLSNLEMSDLGEGSLMLCQDWIHLKVSGNSCSAPEFVV